MARIAVIFCLLLAVVVAAGKKKRPSAITGRIAGGSETEIRKVPYQVSVLYDNEQVCGGSIIGPSYVLTAAHCVRRGTRWSYKIRSGSKYHAEGGVISKVRKISWHPKYIFMRRDYDIALVKLDEPLAYNENTKAIALADKEPKEGEEVFVAGWGLLKEDGNYSSTLRSVKIKVVNRETCKQNYKKSQLDVTENMFCAGVPEGGKGACNADSGGAGVVNGRQAGIVSWSLGCAEKNMPGVYTNVAKFRDWIRNESYSMRKYY